MATRTATKNLRTLQSSASNAAGGTLTSTTWGDGSTGIGALTTSPGINTVMALVTNGGTGPTVGCTVTVNISGDGLTGWKQHAQATAGTASSTAYPFEFDLPHATRYAQVVFSGNTGQAVQVEAQGHEYTSETIA
jgi:hypothetical protein